MQVFSTGSARKLDITINADGCANLALQLGGNISDSDIKVLTRDDASVYSFTNIFKLNGTTNHRNRVRIFKDTNAAVATIDPTSAAFGDNDIKIATEGVRTFTAADATPDVSGVDVCITDTGALTITDFDNGAIGQQLTVISAGAVTFDTTGTDLTGSSVDLLTAAGDVTRWVCEDGTIWRLVGFVDASVDNSAGA